MYLSLLFIGIISVSQGAPTEDHGLSKRVDNGIGVTPAMGFNNWNAGLPSSASTALSAANYFVSLGLKDVGYQYINIDDTWSASARSGGKLIPDPTKWPNGIAAVATQIHNLGLKMGLYGDSGTATCSGFPGSQGYETTDAATLAGWGIDLWKYDNCNTPSGNSQPRYTTMRNALQASGRNIYYAMCNWGADSVWTWGGVTGNSWRVSSDVTNSWGSIVTIASSSQAFASYAAPGGFNDFDMLEIGNGGLTANEERAHFGIWAISKSPLLIGTDLSKISESSLAILKNTDIIAINQDPLGKAASYFQPPGAAAPQSNTLYPYWAGPLSDGVVIGLVAASGAATLSVNFADVPGLGAGTYSWKEAYSGRTGSGTSVSAVLGVHDMAVFRVKKTGGGGVGTSTTSKMSTSTKMTTSTSKMSTTTTKTSSIMTTTMPVTSTTSTAPPTGGMVLSKWSQCGGIGWTGSGTCISGTTCTFSNDWYSQCL